jgi:hypothetical protein
VQLVGDWTGSGASTPIESVAHGKLLPLLGQLALFLLAFYLYKGRAFGVLRDSAAASRRAFADHARALGAQYAKAHAARHALGLYAGYALDRLRERVRLGGRRGLSPLAEAIATRTGREVGEVMRLLVEAQAARDEVAALGGSASGSARWPVVPAVSTAPAPSPGRAAAFEDLEELRRLAWLVEQTGGSR